jgi:hypothetical protein
MFQYQFQKFLLTLRKTSSQKTGDDDWFLSISVLVPAKRKFTNHRLLSFGGPADDRLLADLLVSFRRFTRFPATFSPTKPGKFDRR